MASYGGGGVTVDVPVEDMDKMFADLLKRADGSAERVLERGCEVLIGEASTEDVMPYDEGTLSMSRFNLPDDSAPQGTFKGSMRQIGYHEKYGLVNHETHKTKKRWLTRTILERSKQIFEGLIRKEMASGGGGGGAGGGA